VVISFLYELDDEESQHSSVATAEVPVEVGASRFDLTTAESVVITLLPHAELPY
jgi:hypothetical protein